MLTLIGTKRKSFLWSCNISALLGELVPIRCPDGIESKFSKDLSESTFNEIRELKKLQNIN